ncbi:hypothetical protein HHI36_020906, partial [Cryptolaemus montrouzieri]
VPSKPFSCTEKHFCQPQQDRDVFFTRRSLEDTHFLQLEDIVLTRGFIYPKVFAGKSFSEKLDNFPHQQNIVRKESPLPTQWKQMKSSSKEEGDEVFKKLSGIKKSYLSSWKRTDKVILT